MSKGVKKIAVIVMAVTMLLGVFAFSACSNNSLLRRIEDLENRIKELENDDAKAVRIEELERQLERLRNQNNASQDMNLGLAVEILQMKLLWVW